jgi:hypothetical protein
MGMVSPIRVGEVPVRVVAQIQEHKPSAIAEKHYRRIDLLRQSHGRIESWMLTQAGISLQEVNGNKRNSTNT